ncbi:MAG: VCBS repeat-containing protein [Pyrinomonadaceae bacterium]
MSGKKRRNRDKSPVKAEQISLESIDKRKSFDKTIESSQSGLIYLKSHWWMIVVIAFLSIGALGAGLKYLDEDAKREIARRADNQGKINFVEEPSLLSKINPFVPAPLPNPTPQLSKEYIYAGSRVLAAQDANANAAPPADLAYWRPSTGYWVVMGPSGLTQASQGWGTNGDIPVPGDFDGDGKTDFSIFRPSGNSWWLLRSSDTTYTVYNFGATGDIPAPADYDGDGKTDIALFTPSSGVWYIFQSASSSMITPSIGTVVSGDKPAPADFDGDGRADIGVWRDSTYTFYSKNIGSGQTQSTSLGILGVPAPGDYDGDGKADAAVWSPSNATWYYKKSSDGTTIISYQLGVGTDLPVQNDYDGDGKMDMAVWRAVNTATKGSNVGKWLIYQSSNSTIRQESWGTTGDIPVPAFYRRQ